MADKLENLERKVKLQAVRLQAASEDKGRWITTEKGQRVFIPDGADVKETVEKAIDKRKGGSRTKKLKERMSDKTFQNKLDRDEINRSKDPDKIKKLKERMSDNKFQKKLDKDELERNKPKSDINKVIDEANNKISRLNKRRKELGIGQLDLTQRAEIISNAILKYKGKPVKSDVVRVNRKKKIN